MHNDRIRPAWFFYSVPTPEELRRLDELLTEGINGAEGGTWNPATPIVFGGSGGTIYGTGGLTGPISTVPNGHVPGLVLADNDYPVISPATTISVVLGLRDFFTRRDNIRPEDEDNLPTVAGSTFYPYQEAAPGSIVSSGQSVNFSGTGARATRLVMPIPPHRLIQGTVITDLRLVWEYLPRSASYVPTTSGQYMPGFRVVRHPNDGSFTSGAVNDLYKIPAWLPTHAYATGSIVVPDSGRNSHQYRAVVGGTSAGAALFGSHTVNGLTWADGSVTWLTEPGPAFGTTSGDFCTYQYGADMLAAREIVAPANCLANTTLDLATYSYFVEVFDPSQIGGFPSNVYHAFGYTMGTVDKLRTTY